MNDIWSLQLLIFRHLPVYMLSRGGHGIVWHQQLVRPVEAF